MDIKTILKDMVKRGASDLHIRVGVPPVYRINGKLFRLQLDRLDEAQMDQVFQELAPAHQLKVYQENHECDFAFSIPSVGRFRINAYKQRGTTAMAIRSVSLGIPDFESLNLPEIIRDISLKSRGLILLTGATGSGKSTAMAAMIDHMNEHLSSNIITIEDPIEYLHRDKKCIISQRELRNDTLTFQNALRSALRQDPDVIMVGEIRDHETMSFALTAADTGHLVISTLHTMNAIESLNRIISFYPPHQHKQIRMLLANTLVAIVSLRLLPMHQKEARVPACEVMINTALVKDMILEEGKTEKLQQAIQEGFTQYGSQTFDQSIMNLYHMEMITKEVACKYATNPEDFELKLRGIEGTSDRSWTGV